MDEMINLDEFFKEDNRPDRVYYLEPYETASNINLDEEEEQYINADGTIDIEAEIPGKIYTSRFINEVLEKIGDVALFHGMIRRGDVLNMKFKIPADKRHEFIKRSAEYGLTIRKPRDMAFEPPEDKMRELEMRYTTQVGQVNVYLQGFVHPAKLEEFARSAGLKIEEIRHFTKENKIISTARVVGYTNSKGAAIIDKVNKIAYAFGGIALPLARGILIVGAKV